MGKTAIAGNAGEGIRSDCQVRIELTNAGGIRLDLKSKVKVMFGEEIIRQVTSILDYFQVSDAVVEIEDSGALPFVIAARTEAALKELIRTDREFLPDMLPENLYSSGRETNRFSRLYLPGNTPHLMLNAGIHKPNGIILDLEDAVAFQKKHEARFLVRNALRALDFYGAERMVRINQLPGGLDDLDYLIPHNVNLVLIPKCESAGQVQEVNTRIGSIKRMKPDNEVWLMPIIESARGIVHCEEIAAAAPNVVALAIGLEDFTADLGVMRTQEGAESFYARTRLVIACRAAGIQAIDSVYSDVSDMEGLKETVKRSKSLGFNGMGCIHPRQIPVIHANFAPEDEEIEKAKRIYLAFKEAEARGLGVVSLGTKMIDPPVVKRAERVIRLAVETGKLSKNWEEEL